MGGPDTGVTTTRLQAIEVALEDVQAHELPATLVICREREMPLTLCGPKRKGGGCVFCVCHDVAAGDVAEEIEKRVASYV